MTIQITKQNSQLQNLHCPMTKQYCIVFRTVKCGLVSTWVFRANPNFSICFRIDRTSNFSEAVIIQFFQPFIHYFSENSCFFCSFCKLFRFYPFWRKVWKLTEIQTTTVPRNSVKFFLYSKSFAL